MVLANVMCSELGVLCHHSLHAFTLLHLPLRKLYLRKHPCLQTFLAAFNAISLCFDLRVSPLPASFTTPSCVDTAN
jgi:hypothetical protein